MKFWYGGEVVEVYDITYDKDGFPTFLIYKDKQWNRVSAKHFVPVTKTEELDPFYTGESEDYARMRWLEGLRNGTIGDAVYWKGYIDGMGSANEETEN